MTSDKELEALIAEHCRDYEPMTGRFALSGNDYDTLVRTFERGARAGMRLQAERDAKLVDGYGYMGADRIAAAIRAAAQGDGK